MMEFIENIALLMIGATIGVVIMCFMQVSAQADRSMGNRGEDE